MPLWKGPQKLENLKTSYRGTLEKGKPYRSWFFVFFFLPVLFNHIKEITIPNYNLFKNFFIILSRFTVYDVFADPLTKGPVWPVVKFWNLIFHFLIRHKIWEKLCKYQAADMPTLPFWAGVSRFKSKFWPPVRFMFYLPLFIKKEIFFFRKGSFPLYNEVVRSSRSQKSPAYYCTFYNDSYYGFFLRSNTSLQCVLRASRDPNFIKYFLAPQGQPWWPFEWH